MLEVWSTINDEEVYPIYEISTLGKVRNKQRPDQYLNQSLLNGYLCLKLYGPNGRRTKKVHRLVASTYLENYNNLKVVHHKDGNRLNNYITNLTFISMIDNTIEYYKSPVFEAKRKIKQETPKHIKRIAKQNWVYVSLIDQIRDQQNLSVNNLQSEDL